MDASDAAGEPWGRLTVTEGCYRRKAPRDLTAVEYATSPVREADMGETRTPGRSGAGLGGGAENSERCTGFPGGLGASPGERPSGQGVTPKRTIRHGCTGRERRRGWGAERSLSSCCWRRSSRGSAATTTSSLHSLYPQPLRSPIPGTPTACARARITCTTTAAADRRGVERQEQHEHARGSAGATVRVESDVPPVNARRPSLERSFTAPDSQPHRNL